MRLFLSEYLCSGALAGESLPESLLREGRAMWDAAATDFARLDDVKVVTTCDERIAPPEGIEILAVRSADEEAQHFERLCRECDATLVIAPELSGELSRRVRLAAALSPQPLNCTSEAVDLCADKFATSLQLRRAGLRALPTWSMQQHGNSDGRSIPRNDAALPTYPLVVKPRCGAGSQATYLCRDADDLRRHWHEYDGSRTETQPVLQPYIRGRSLSVAGCFDLQTHHLTQLLPIAIQHISDNGLFQYQGGELPARDVDTLAIEQLVRGAATAIHGLRGYVGFDLLIPDESPDAPLLVEINPRLTTSYIGYRALAETNLAPLILGRPLQNLRWNPGRIHFDAAGDFNRSADPAAGE